jgi:malate dehydrogenase (oxaloacetate-decarboxylating)
MVKSMAIIMAERKPTVEELLKKAERPSKLAVPYHQFYEGKVQVMPKCAIRTLDDFSIWYTPGVAAACKEIKADPDKSFFLTNRWNYVAVVSDGTRVLGLGNIGPEAGLPVMEGKALLFKYLGGVDAFPLVVRARDPDDMIKLLEWIEPNFGGVNLEDIEKPKCYYVLEEARKRLQIPVWHDDQQGTATVVYAGLVNAFKLVGKNMKDSKIVLYGAGAANIRTAIVLITAGVPPGNIVLIDTAGVLYRDRPDMETMEKEDRWKYDLAMKTNKENNKTIEEAFKGADAVVGASKPGPGVIKQEWIKLMNKDPIVFACANPIPEIWPWEAKEAGAKIVATGRSDFPNQVNNSLAFPAIFRGVLDVRAKTVTDEMCIAAGDALAKFAEEKGLREDYILPTMEDWEVYPIEAVAAAEQSIKQGVARRILSREELYERAVNIIRNARESARFLMEKGLISSPPPEEDVLRSYGP